MLFRSAWNARLVHDILGARLIAHVLDGGWWRSNEDESSISTFLSKCRVLAQLIRWSVCGADCEIQNTYKAIARVDAVAPVLFGRLDDLVAIKVC